jgi:hypothetical protein
MGRGWAEVLQQVGYSQPTIQDRLYGQQEVHVLRHRAESKEHGQRSGRKRGQQWVSGYRFIELYRALSINDKSSNMLAPI